MHVDVDAGLVRSGDAQAFLVGGVGTRIGQGPALGALLGFAAEGRPGGFLLGGRVEARKQSPTFRQGFFGPQYELSRFASVGDRGVPIADEVLPDSWSGYGELSLSAGPELPSPDGRPGPPRLFITLSGEYFTFGRSELDLEVAVRAFGDRLALFGRVTGVGLGVTPRFCVSLEGRFRFAGSLYAIAQAGTADFPQPDGTLTRGLYGSVGMGLDFAR
jgi:hypothetical protein